MKEVFMLGAILSLSVVSIISFYIHGKISPNLVSLFIKTNNSEELKKFFINDRSDKKRFILHIVLNVCMVLFVIFLILGVSLEILERI